MTKVVLLVGALLVGCSFSGPPPKMVRSSTSIIVIESDRLPIGVKGTAIVSGDKCIITLQKYPYCLQHEVRHCLEGNWHQGYNTVEDCGF